MKSKIKKEFLSLGSKISFVFLTASAILIFIAYFVLSQSFQNLLKDYSLEVTESMVNQGVTTIEYEVKVSKNEVKVYADAFIPPNTDEDEITFPNYAEKNSNILRISYVANGKTISSDKQNHDIHERQDVLNAYQNEIALYGPYYNEYKEYVICYSAPVKQNGKIVGVLSVEKDAYQLSELIKNIRFINSGESYIINSEGTDIAVSNLEHISWVKTQYNAQRLLEEGNATEDTESILALEKKGLQGETGIGTYIWEGSLCYLAYKPIPSTNWVLLAGLREEEIRMMSKSVFFDSITNGPILGIGITIFILLTLLIIYWIIMSLKKNAEINDKLNILANYDSLTDTLNRNSYHDRIEELSKQDLCSFACIYIDANGLHEINNSQGHQAGDWMLKTIAKGLNEQFSKQDIYRIGGDEFVVFCLNEDQKSIQEKIHQFKQKLVQENFYVSIGMQWSKQDIHVSMIINKAEESMQQDKKAYYKKQGKNREMRELNNELENLIMHKHDADTFLSLLVPYFKGIYFVDLRKDKVRHLYLPDYFEKILQETKDSFSKALVLYSERLIKEAYREGFQAFCDYANIENRIMQNITTEFLYQKEDDTWMKLQILKFKGFNEDGQETLWAFIEIEK